MNNLYAILALSVSFIIIGLWIIDVVRFELSQYRNKKK
jgi:hypothetical protein